MDKLALPVEKRVAGAVKEWIGGRAQSCAAVHACSRGLATHALLTRVKGLPRRFSVSVFDASLTAIKATRRSCLGAIFIQATTSGM